VSPSRRRQAVLMLQDRLGVSERRACQIAGQHRSTQRREPCVAGDDAALRAALRELSRERPRWGYRRAHARLLEDGWVLNRKRSAAAVARGGPAGPAGPPRASASAVDGSGQPFEGGASQPGVGA
jgi:hypothetical protein